MKKIDTFFLSDKQIEQMKKNKKPNKNLAKIALIALGSAAGLLLASHAPQIFQSLGISGIDWETVESVLTGITGFGVIYGVVKIAGKSNKSRSPLPIDSDTRKDLEEACKDDYYPDEVWDLLEYEAKKSGRSK